MSSVCRRCRTWRQNFPTSQGPVRNVRSVRIPSSAQQRAVKEKQRPLSRILQYMRTSAILAPFRRMNAALNRIPGPYRRFIGNTLKLTPIFLLVFSHFPYQIMHTNGSSMSPFLNPNNAPHLPETRDRILVKRLGSYDLWGFWMARLSRGGQAEQPLQRGEIVVFNTPHDPSKIAVKRIVGLPGDVVTPLAGYEGSSSVTIQHNHLWVEGDADDRDKSRDSNWYGPISASLVIGRVTAILEPWYHPRWLDPLEHQWPARRKSRVAESIPSSNPDDLDRKQRWLDGQADILLSGLHKRANWLHTQLITSADKRNESARIYAHAWRERGADDPRTRAATGAVVEMLDAIFDRAGLQIVVDAHDDSNASLVRTEAGEQILKDFYRKKSEEERLSPEELVERRRMALDLEYEKRKAEIEGYDEWSWYDRYRPKSVVKAKLERMRGEVERKQREWEEEVMREVEKERERARRVEDGEKGYKHTGLGATQAEGDGVREKGIGT